MRATISFDTDVEQVEGKMAVLACAEEHNLRAAADILSNHNILEFSTLDSITEVLRLLEDSTTQLQQYRNMLVNFERAKYETVLPQGTNQAVVNIGEAVNNLNKFGDFIDRLNSQDTEEDGTENAEPATEG
jgi:uncharacterized protein YoxC